MTVRGRGRGGRCQEFALAAALSIEGDDSLTVLAAGTDGTDGPTDAAGAVVDGSTIKEVARLVSTCRLLSTTTTRTACCGRRET